MSASCAPIDETPPVPLSLRGITRRYPAVVANDNVSLDLVAGEIHGLIGENGAGKSTLMKIAYGLEQPDAGQILWHRSPIEIRSPLQARTLGIGMVFQHFSLLDTLTVLENVALMRPGERPSAALAERLTTLAARYGLALDPQAHVANLSVGERQRVEIVRILMMEPSVLILDEPTAVLTPQAIDALFATLRRLAQEGVAILLISHKLEEVRRLCDRATVLRLGRVTGTCLPADEDVASLSRMMLGDTPPGIERARATPSVSDAKTARLLVQSLHLHADLESATGLSVESLRVDAGEIVGIAGISGNGQAQLLDVLSGERRLAPKDAQSLLLDGVPVGAEGVSRRRTMGLVSVPEERLGRACVAELPLASNVALTHQNARTLKWGMLRFGALKQIAVDIIERLDVRTAGASARAGSLSGGNLQKFVIGRALAHHPRMLVIAQPTWGVDVGSAARVHAAILALRDQGAAVLIISEDLEELFLLSDAMYVLADGRLSERLATASLTTESIGPLMAGEVTQ